MTYEIHLRLCKILVCASFVLIAIGTIDYLHTRPVAWDHGWKTNRVVATRYNNKLLGYTIGFSFPLDYYNSDREEVDNFMENHGGSIYNNSETGEAFTRFDDVKDRATADVKIKQIIGPLSTVMWRMAWGLPAGVPEPVEKYTWPNTEAPDKTDPYWQVNNNMNDNGVPYWKIEVSPGHWQWQINQKIQQEMIAEEAHRQKVWQDLSTIRMDSKELEDARGYGTELNIVPMVPYTEAIKAQEFNRAWAIQEALQKQKAM